MSPQKTRKYLVIALALAIGGCAKPQPLPLVDIKKDYDRPLPPGQFALRQIDPSQYPAFGEGWYKAKGTTLREAITNSINYLNKPSSKKYYPLGPITHERAMASLHTFLQILDQANSPEALDQLIRDNFDVYMSIGCDDEGTVLFTGYYSPIFDGSLTQTEQFNVPLYRLPPDLQKDEEGNPIGGPWKTREEIETSGILAGQEIAWVGDRFEAYVFTVQGSGFIRLPDGSLTEIGYAGHNGHEYTPIGKQLIADGKIDRFKLSLDTMIRHFKEHPEDLDVYLFQNQRYVFFRESAGGPYGCLAERVIPYHSIATDKEIFPRACLAFTDTRIPHEPGVSMRPFRSFVLDQDRGAAIRAPGRTDIYMGVGEDAGKMAGFTYSEGKLYYLFVKEGVSPQQSIAQQTPPPTDEVPVETVSDQ
ncbi:MAG TPA: MltA domain-containing protein [Phycisphaerae bacterium]|nr:MltA domain-containing protein [Phycisphaerae bacterium]